MEQACFTLSVTLFTPWFTCVSVLWLNLIAHTDAHAHPCVPLLSEPTSKYPLVSRFLLLPLCPVCVCVCVLYGGSGREPVESLRAKRSFTSNIPPKLERSMGLSAERVNTHADTHTHLPVLTPPNYSAQRKTWSPSDPHCFAPFLSHYVFSNLQQSFFLSPLFFLCRHFVECQQQYFVT